MAAATQVGTSLKIGYGTNVLTGYIMEDFESSTTAEDEVIKDEDNATGTVILFNPATQIKFSALIKGTGSLTPPARGDSITINSIKYRCTDASVAQSRGVSKLNITAIKEASMTYT